MALVTLLIDATTTVANTPLTTPNFTPAAGDLLIVFVQVSSSDFIAPTLTDSQGLGWTTLGTVTTTPGGSDIMAAYVANKSATASSMTVTAAPDGSTSAGMAMAVLRAHGTGGVTGNGAVRQTATQSSQVAGTTPSVTFSQSGTGLNPALFAISNDSNPAGVSAPAGWTQRDNIGYNPPSTGLTVATIDVFSGTV